MATQTLASASSQMTHTHLLSELALHNEHLGHDLVIRGSGEQIRGPVQQGPLQSVGSVGECEGV